MLKTFEMKMKDLNAQRITREHIGNNRYDTWRLPYGIEFLAIHFNEHLSIMTIQNSSVAECLAENKNQCFTAKGFEDAMQFLKITYMPIHQNGEFLVHSLYFEPKETLFTSKTKDGRLVANGECSGFGVVIGDEIYDDINAKGILAKLPAFEPLDYRPESITKWIKAHPQVSYRIEGLLDGVNQMIERKNTEETFHAMASELTKSLGLDDASVSVSSPEELAEELHRLQNNPDTVAAGFACFDSNGIEINQDNATIEEFVEAITGVKVEKPIIPESNLPS